ncbi:MAG TPA: aminomethyl-transferring glycine dehydrogenase [Gemmatimonadales bacterium]|jgi:glycine dehydrogenase
MTTRFDDFASRHIGPNAEDVRAMLEIVGYPTLDAFIDQVVPSTIRLDRPLDLPPAMSERDAIHELRRLASKNTVFRSYLGMGYSDTITPPVILRNILENPGWYTAYTPYQAEIAQGRLEALLNFQTMVSDLTGLEVANASLLDEATAAAEAMHLTVAASKVESNPVYLIDTLCHPQTIAVVRTRAEAIGVEIVVGEPGSFEFKGSVVGALVQYPGTDGGVRDFRGLAEKAHQAGALVTAATDLLALALITAPGEWGADIAVGNTQRFGVPLGYGGPHAAFFATKDQYKRILPGRIIGVSKDRAGRPGMRMALGTREQHIRREKATSNICTAQVLLAVCAGMYAVWHGPDGIRRIAERVHARARSLAAAAKALGYTLVSDVFFDTVALRTDAATAMKIHDAARGKGINLRALSPTTLAVAFDETVTGQDVADVVGLLALGRPTPALRGDAPPVIGSGVARTSAYLTHPVFSRYRSETEMLRYLKKLEDKDLSLTSAMIPLGSCTMKLNATTEMKAVTWPEFGRLHPFAPRDQAAGYGEMFTQLEKWLAEITGFAAVSLQPNAGSQGEFAGLLVIRAYHRAKGDTHRTTCLIPASAHGTNPASAVMAGMDVVVVKTSDKGEIDLADLEARAEEHKDSLGALMVTYPSTHGVFEATIRDVCRIVHQRGGQVYMDGANMNAQVGLCRPGDIGADVCHLNLHKTFCIPHGGGGPGMGPIGVAPHLAPFLPNHPVIDLGHAQSCGTISAAPWGSPSILPISWAYCAMMGPEGLTHATKIAILSANYIAKRLAPHIQTLYAGPGGLVAHECILDTRPFDHSAGIKVTDIAKRLIDYGFHPPTVSFPVAGTLMVEPTESESKEELDRFVDALIAIRGEITEIERGEADRGNNLLTNSPHPLQDLLSEEWNRPYSRERAAFPTPATREHKIWPPVSRIDDAFGDRNLICTCPPIEEYAKA